VFKGSTAGGEKCHLVPEDLFDRRAWPPHEPGADPATAAEVEGDLVVHVVDFGERSEKVYGFRLDDGGQRALALPEPPAVPGGTRVRVRGADDGSTIHVRFRRRIAAVSQARSRARWLPARRSATAAGRSSCSTRAAA
jgi:hypothetical protein